MPTTNERLESDLLMAAELVDRYPDLMPYLERVEREYHALRRPPEAERIRAMIAQHRKEDSRD